MSHQDPAVHLPVGITIGVAVWPPLFRYTIDHYADEGLMFEGASVPFSIASLGVPWTGRRYMDLMEQYPHLATFGFMIQDESRGEVRPGIGGAPQATGECAGILRPAGVLPPIPSGR